MEGRIVSRYGNVAAQTQVDTRLWLIWEWFSLQVEKFMNRLLCQTHSRSAECLSWAGDWDIVWCVWGGHWSTCYSAWTGNWFLKKCLDLRFSSSCYCWLVIGMGVPPQSVTAIVVTTTELHMCAWKFDLVLSRCFICIPFANCVSEVVSSWGMPQVFNGKLNIVLHVKMIIWIPTTTINSEYKRIVVMCVGCALVGIRYTYNLQYVIYSVF